MQQIIDAAGGEDEPLSEDEMERYEQLDRELAVARRSQEIRQRQQAYTTPVRNDLHVYVGTARQDDGLERAFESYLRTGVVNQDIAQLRAQGEGTSAGGGYLVPPGFRDKIVERMVSYGGLAAEVDSFNTTTGNNIEYPTMDDTANVGGITAESAAVASGNDLVFGTVALGAYKYTSAGAGSNLPLRVSTELLQDAAFPVQEKVSKALGTRIARAQAAHWCTGTGVGQPKGIVADSLTANETLDVSDVIDYDDILDTEAALDPSYEQNAVWVMNKAAWTQIRAIVDTAGRPIVMRNDESGIGTGVQKSLLGYRVVIDQQMPNLVDTAAFFAVLGDLKEAYVIRRVSNMVVVVNPYSRATNGEVEFTAWERADGNIQNRNAYAILRNV
jgi:HK97 family phage major capsid protein